MSLKKINDRLRSERKRWRLTQSELASLTSVKARSFISQIELSSRKPPLEFALACETVFGKPIRQLFPKLSKSTEKRVLRYAGFLHHALIKSADSSANEKRKLIRRILASDADGNNKNA